MRANLLLSDGIAVDGDRMFGAGSSLIILDEMACQGSEGSIADCRHSTWGNHNCDHSEDVGVICGKKTIECMKYIYSVYSASHVTLPAEYHLYLSIYYLIVHSFNYSTATYGEKEKKSIR